VLVSERSEKLDLLLRLVGVLLGIVSLSAAAHHLVVDALLRVLVLAHASREPLNFGLQRRSFLNKAKSPNDCQFLDKHLQHDSL
jgi:hypothetical protein